MKNFAYFRPAAFAAIATAVITWGGLSSHGQEPVTAGGHPAEGKLEPFLGEPRLEVQQIFTGERFPTSVVAVDGTILATWGADTVRVRRSLDGGETWGPEILIGSGWQGGGAVVDENTGDILVMVEDGHPPGAPVTFYRSTDHGESWVEEDVVLHPDENDRLPSMHTNEHGITLRHGEHAGRLLRPSRSYGRGNEREYWPEHYTNAMYSDDGGQTWHTSAPFPANGTGEAAVAELSDGRIYYNSRRHLSTDGLDPRKRHIAWSDDGGETWKDLSVSDVLPDGPQNIDYGLMAGLVRLPVAGRDILIFSNVDSPGKPERDDRGWSERRDGTVWASFDGGQTWPLKRLVYEGPFSYSSLAAGRPGTPSEGWIYLQFEGGPNGPHSDGQMARFNLSWLLEGELTGDGEPPVLPKDGEPVSLFDGETLDGWEIRPGEEKWWGVRDGAITGGSLDETVPHNTFLASAKSFENFDLQFKIRIVEGEGFQNSGLQVRSIRMEGSHEMIGYQVDAGIGYWGDIYDESRRNTAIARPIDPEALAAAVNDWDWNDYRILCEGPRIRTWINGELAHDFVETDSDIPRDGFFGLQAHSGGRFLVQMKDVMIRELPPTPGAPTWASSSP